MAASEILAAQWFSPLRNRCGALPEADWATCGMDAAPLADATTVEYLSCGPNTASGAADWSAARHSAFADHESGLLLAACGPFVAVNDIVVSG